MTKYRPPIEWIANFATGDCQTKFKPKLSGTTKKSDLDSQEIAPKNDTTDSLNTGKLMELLLLSAVKSSVTPASHTQPTQPTVIYAGHPQAEN